jgi:hypothetical protein
VTITQFRNFYTFTKRREVYALYIVALLCAGICLVLGTRALHRSGGVYNTDPSTILRLHRDPSLIHLLSTETDDAVLLGAAPRPENLSHTDLRLRLPLDSKKQGLRVVSLTSKGAESKEALTTTTMDRHPSDAKAPSHVISLCPSTA